MIKEKYMGHISIIAMFLAVIFIVSALYIQPNKDSAENNNTIIEEVLNKEKITEVNIEIDEADWQWLLENATKEEYRSGNITINGETFYNVGIRPKGNSSLSMVAGDDTTDRFSLKIDFGEYVDGQTYHGISKLALNNMMSDTTYMKEYISYDVLSFLDVPTPEYSYTDISINGEEWGLYLAVEVIEERFVEKNFGSLEGNLYKPDSISNEDQEKNKGGMPGGMPQGEMPQGEKVKGEKPQGGMPQGDMPQGENPQGQMPQGEMPPMEEKQNGIPNENIAGNTSENTGKAANEENLGQNGNQQGKMNKSRGAEGGGNLKYIDDKTSSYTTIIENTVFETTTEKDFEKVVDMIKSLNEGKDIEKYIDVEEVLAYFAVNTFLVNLDSYSGGMYHNYYLYEKDGVFQIIPWDYNMSFAGFMMNDSSQVINFPIDNPVTGDLSDAPLIEKLLEVDEYKEIYHEYLRKLANEYFTNGSFEEKINNLDKLIGDYVKKDNTAFYSYDEYTKSLIQLNTFGEDRTTSILAQLEGTQPSTTYGNITTTLNLTELGGTATMGNKGGNKGGMPSMENMKAVMDIIQNSDIENLTEEQKVELKELGVNEEMLSQLKNMAPGMGKPPMGNMQGTQENNTALLGLGMSGIIQLGVSTIVLLGGLIFVMKFKRKR